MIHRPASRGISGYPFMGKEHGLSPSSPPDLLQEKGCRHRAHAVTGLAEGGETGLKHGGVFYVVKANHGEIFWNAEPPFPGGLEGTKGQARRRRRTERWAGPADPTGVRRPQRRWRSCNPGRQILRSWAGVQWTVPLRRSGNPDGARRRKQSCFRSDKADAGVAQGRQAADRLPRCGKVINGNVADVL